MYQHKHPLRAPQEKPGQPKRPGLVDCSLVPEDRANTRGEEACPTWKVHVLSQHLCCPSKPASELGGL